MTLHHHTSIHSFLQSHTPVRQVPQQQPQVRTNAPQPCKKLVMKWHEQTGANDRMILNLGLECLHDQDASMSTTMIKYRSHTVAQATPLSSSVKPEVTAVLANQL